MSINRIDAINDHYFSISQNRLEQNTAIQSDTPAPASALAVPIETARAQVNASFFMIAMMRPTSDGIFVVGSVSVRPVSQVKGIAAIQPMSSWRFF